MASKIYADGLIGSSLPRCIQTPSQPGGCNAEPSCRHAYEREARRYRGRRVQAATLEVLAVVSSLLPLPGLRPASAWLLGFLFPGRLALVPRGLLRILGVGSGSCADSRGFEGFDALMRLDWEELSSSCGLSYCKLAAMSEKPVD